MQYVGFWWRVLAYIVDGVILNIAMFVVMLGAGGAMIAADGTPNMGVAGVVYFLLIAMCIAYDAFFVSSKFMATPGKMVIGVIVVKPDGARMSLANAFGRSAGKILSAIILYIGFIMAAFTEKKQGLHDMLANSIVIKRASWGGAAA